MRTVPVSLGHLPASAIVWSREITQLKEVEARLRQAQKMEAVGRLAGGIGHDFNNILTGVIGNADLLLEQLEEATTPHDDAKEIRALAARAADLTGRLLTFSRRQPLELSPLDLGTVLEEMRLMLGRLIGSHIRLHTRLPREPVWVLADPAQLQQIVLNLALNARDVMPDGGDLTITLRKRPWPGSLGPAPRAGTGAARRWARVPASASPPRTASLSNSAASSTPPTRPAREPRSRYGSRLSPRRRQRRPHRKPPLRTGRTRDRLRSGLSW